MTEPLRLYGVKDTRRQLKQLDAGAARTLNKALKKSLTVSVLPKVNSRTPQRTGRLRGRNRVTATAKGIGIANSLPYSNAVHWGRNFWPDQTAPNRRPSPTRAVPFIWQTVEDERPSVLEDIRRAFDESIAEAAGTTTT